MDLTPPDKLPVPPNGNEYVGTVINAFAWWTTAVTIVFVALRFITVTAILKNRPWWDDWHILVAEIATIAGAVLVSLEVQHGYGRHAYYLSVSDVTNFLALNYGSWIVTFFILMCTKVSICLFLIKLPGSRRVRRPLWVAVALIVFANLLLGLIWVLQCAPAYAAWTFNVNSTCLGRPVVLHVILAQAILSAVCDYALALYPLLVIGSWDLTIKKRIGVCVLMGLGVVVGSCSVVRAFLNSQALSDDATYTPVANWFWRLFETQLGIVCACVPTLIPLYEWARDKIVGEKRSSITSLMNAFPSPTRQDRHDHESLGQTASPSVGSEPSTSEKGIIFKPAISNRQGECEDEVMMSSALRSRPTELRTFYSDDSREDVLATVADQPLTKVASPTKTVTFSDPPGKNMSFSTRDRQRHGATIRARPPTSLPSMLLTTPSGRREPPTPPPFEGPRTAPHRPLVHVNEEEQSLEIDLAPNFQTNRTAFGRLFEINRGSWRSSFTSLYSSRNSNPAGGYV